MRLLGVVAVAVAVATGVSVAAPGDAAACSCVRIDARAWLARADAAFIGTLVERRVEDDLLGHPRSAVSTFRVERALKGTLREFVDVESEALGASCGLEVEPGQSIGLLVERGEHGWRSNLCLQVEPRRLAAVAQPRAGTLVAGRDEAAGDDERRRRVVAAVAVASVLVAAVVAVRLRRRLGGT